MTIDAHQHFWKYSPEEYAWIDDSMSVIGKDFLPPDLAPLLKKAGISGCVAIQAAQTEAETRFLLDLSHKHPFIMGVVGWLDMLDPNLAERVEVYLSVNTFKGVRHTVQSEPNGYMTAPAFIKGLRTLGSYGLTYDLLISEGQLGEAFQLISQLPDQDVVIDHIAKPNIRIQSYAHWSRWMKKISVFPNVSVKLSGMITEADWSRWKKDDLKPYLDFCIETFGPERLMFGSDWPVCLLASDYSAVVAVVQDHICTLSQTDQNAVLGQTAIRFYKLNT